MIKIIELFGGIGAPRKALESMGINIKSIDYVEILPYAVMAYNAMFNNNYKLQSVVGWNLEPDILIHGSPCQDFSKNGKNNINTGRSILYRETLNIIESKFTKRPRIVLWENVPNLIHKHKEHFNYYLAKMEEMGYKNYYEILKVSDYNIPQARDRVYVVSILDCDTEFVFPEPMPLKKDIRHYLDKTTTFEEYPLSENEQAIIFKNAENKMCVKEATKLGYKEFEEYDIINLERPTSTTRRGRIGTKVAKTITTNPRQAIYYDGNIRMLNALEHVRLMGFQDSDYKKMKKAGLTDAQISALAGNSICIPVLIAIFKELCKLNLINPNAHKDEDNNDDSQMSLFAY
jgi:DNA (cytosine-5)-methyltransferase 1